MNKIFNSAIPCLRHDNLVYITNFKCASTFFYNNFQKTFKWQQIKFEDITWGTDHVFSHILDPIERRVKGIAEFIDMLDLPNSFIKNIGLQFLIQQTPLLDIHSVPYCIMFGEYARKIDWIPLEQSKMSNVLVTQKLLNYFGIIVNTPDWDLSYEHAGNIKKKQVEEIIRKNQYDNNLHNEFVWQNLYNNIKSNNWPECPTIDNFITLPTKIRKELATHCIGKHFTISEDFKTLNTLSENNFRHDWLAFYRDDIKLFQDIETNFDRNNNSWDKISWLLK
jgi:hypothetical protein